MITVTQEKAEKNEETVKISLIVFRVDISSVGLHNFCLFLKKDSLNLFYIVMKFL